MPGAAPGPERRRLVIATAVAGVFTAIAAAFTTSTYAMYTLKHEPYVWWKPLAATFGEWYVYAALSPLVFGLARRVPVTGDGWRRALAVHLAGFAAFDVVSQAIFALFERSAGIWGMELGYGEHLLLYATKRAAFVLLIYAGIAGAAHMADLYRRYRERELRGAQLETRLARAQLQVLRNQLHPHFLFNTLNSISALMRRDVEAADRVVTRLGDLLRLSLQHAERQEVTLRHELEFLERYVEIQRTRFRDRLTVRLAPDPDTLDAMVPSLVLQPLVENAIRHGIEPRAAAGRVEVRARRDDGRLTLEVVDDGVGLASGCGEGHANGNGCSGIGLLNTRARLEQLYGDQGRFAIESPAAGGVRVVLEIPYRTAAIPTPPPVAHA